MDNNNALYDEKVRSMEKWQRDYEHALETPIVSAEDLADTPLPLEVIEDDEHLFAVMCAWKEGGIEEVAVDLEFESSLHYRDVTQLCTVQIFDNEKYYLIDAIKLTQPGLTGLKVFFETRDFVKLWFATGSDRFVLKKHGYKLVNAYDIQKAPGCGLKGRSLTVFVDALLGESLSDGTPLPDGKEPRSKKAMQTSNWVLRPISLEQVVYSLNDVKYLFRLRDAALSAPKITNPKISQIAPVYETLLKEDKCIAKSIYSFLNRYSLCHVKPIIEFMDPQSVIILARSFGVIFPDKIITQADVMPYLFGIPMEESIMLATEIADRFNRLKIKKLNKMT